MKKRQIKSENTIRDKKPKKTPLANLKAKKKDNRQQK
jgi:hypothetical protein